MTKKTSKIVGSVDFSHKKEEVVKPMFHVGDEIKFRDVDGKAYILKVMREAEE